MNSKYFVNLTKNGRNLIRKKRELIFGSQNSASRIVGINQSIISDWERGRYKPILSSFREYINYLKINPDFLNNSKFSNVIYFSPYEKDAPKIKKLKTYRFQSLDRNILLTKKGRKFLKNRRLRIFGSQYNVALVNNINQSSISYWESGKVYPTLQRLKSYLKILKIPYNKFLKNKEYCFVSTEKIITRMIRNGNIASKKKILKQRKLTSEKAYILGVVGPGDGYVGTDEIQLRIIDKEFADIFHYCLEKVYGFKPSRTIIKPEKLTFSKTYKVNFCSKAAVEDIKKYAKHFKEYNWQLPKAIINSPEKIKCAYLRGVFDSQAHVSAKKYEITMYLYNLNGLYKIKKLLKSIGIKSHVSFNNQILRISGKRNLELFAMKINFIIKRKRKSIEKLLGSYRKR